MNTTKIGILICSLSKCNCFETNENEKNELIRDGYLNEDYTITKKAETLLNSFEMFSKAYESSNEFKDNCLNFVTKVNDEFKTKVKDAKNTTSDVLSFFSGVLDEASKNLKK